MSPAVPVGVLGARGRMGREVVRAVAAAPDLDLVAEVGRGEDLEPLRAARVVVDFTSPAVVMGNLEWVLGAGLCAVVGTSGFDEARLAELGRLVDAAPGQPGVVVAANFGVGAVLLARFAREAAPWFDGVEIVELHHAAKVDAPSGTARATASAVAAARAASGRAAGPDATRADVSLAGARGAAVDGVPVHAVRLPGLLAHQEVLFGGTGELLTLRHDTLDRAAFMPGVLLAVRAVLSRPGLTVGLEPLLDSPPD